MALEMILDRIAGKAAAVTGVAKAYATGAGTATAAMYPETLEPTPGSAVAVVRDEGGDLTIVGGFERFDHRIAVDLYVFATPIGEAYRLLAPFPERFRVAFRSDVDATASADQVLMTGYGPPSEIESGGRLYLMRTINLMAIEHASATYTV